MAMTQGIKIENQHGETVGNINFNVNPAYLSVSRTAAGFQMSLPAELSLLIVGEGEPLPLLRGLWGTLYAASSPNANVEIGRIEDKSWHSTGWAKKPGMGSPSDVRMTWMGTFAELAVFEKLREGRPPELQLQLWGELCYLLPSEHPRYQICTAPQLIHGSTIIKYPKEIWVDKLRSLGVLENVLVEIPLPASPPAPWDEVWANLVSARNHFEQGGSTGWSSCILAVRQALEKWRDIEQPQTGPPDPTKRSKRERLNNLRQALHQCTHVWIHRDEEATRDDALLMLSTLSALLAERKP